MGVSEGGRGWDGGEREQGSSSDWNQLLTPV